MIIVAQSPMLHKAHDADDFAILIETWIRDREMLSNGIFIRKNRFRQNFINHGDGLRVQAISIVVKTPAQQVKFHHVDVIRAGEIVHRPEHVEFRRTRRAR